MIIVGAILPIVFMAFSACNYKGSSDRGDIPFNNVQYIRTSYSSESNYRGRENITIVSSQKELKQYYEKHRGNDFLKAIEKYSEDYFSDHFLVIVELEETSGSIRHKVAGITENGYIRIARLSHGIPSLDMASWSIIIELDNRFNAKKFHGYPPRPPMPPRT